MMPLASCIFSSNLSNLWFRQKKTVKKNSFQTFIIYSFHLKIFFYRHTALDAESPNTVRMSVNFAQVRSVGNCKYYTVLY